MSDELASVVDPDIAPAPPAPVAEQPPAVEPPQAAAEDEIPEAVEVQPGVQVVPVGVVKALREELKALKPQAQRAAELERESAENRAIVEFIKANPQILQGQPQAQPQPQAPPNPQDDPALVEYAKTLDLYTLDGRPDTTRAAKLRDMTRQEAAAIAQQAVAPMQEATQAQQAAQNLTWMTGLKDANGQKLEEQFVIETVRTVYGNLPKAEAIKVLADPNVAQVLAYTALGRQAASKPYQPPVPAPQAAPLHVESAGGGTALNVSEDHVRRLGVSAKQYQETGKRFQYGKANPLE